MSSEYEEPATVEVVGALDHYALLASAVAGQPLQVGVTERPLAYTDGEAVYVPIDADPESIVVSVVVQAALLAAGSLDRSLVGSLTARRTLARRYLMCESARAMAVRAHIVPPPVAKLVAATWTGRLPEDATESFKRSQSRELIPEAPPSFGVIRPRSLRTPGRAPSGGAPSTLDRQGKTEFEPTPEMDDEDESESLQFMKALAAPINIFGENPLMKWMRNNFGIGSRPSPAGGGVGGEMPAGGASWGEEAGDDAQPVLAVATGVGPRLPEGPPGHFSYPEWDAVEERYRPDHCRVRALDPATGTELLRRRDPAGLRRELARLGLDYERHRRQLDGPDLDLEAVVDFTVARARREQPDDRLYQVRLKTARDMAVLVLLDASGSTGNRGRAGQTVFAEERQLVAELVEVLDELGDRVAAFGFNSRGPGLVRFLRIKEFDSPFDNACKARLAGVTPNGYTRLGAGIRHATHLLTTLGGASNRLLVVVSDGLPFDDGYEGRYAEQDTRKALDEAVAQGVGCLCVSVGASKDDAALADLWGAASHLRLHDASDLSTAIGPLLRTALLVASQRGGVASA